MLTIEAPAKLNLTLEVLGKRPDGYHEIRSVVQTLDLCDRLHFHESSLTEFKSAMPKWIARESLVSRAVVLLKEATGCTAGVAIEIDKRIPLLSGLGGDSSDAAAALVGLNRLWELDLPQERLLELATELGSDVAFFLCGGTALMEGRGELVAPLPPLSETWIVLVVPAISPEPGKTGRAYAGLQASDYTDGQHTERLVSALKAGSKLELSMLFNVFERVVYSINPEISEYRRLMMVTGAEKVQLAGSGPTLFTIADSEKTAAQICSRLSQQGVEAHLTGAAGLN